MLSSYRKRHSGVSLIEIAVVLTIVGILLAMAAPGVGEWIRNIQIRNAASSLQSGLQRARAEAIRRNVPVRFTLLTTQANLTDACAADATGASWIVSRKDPSGSCASTESEADSTPQIIEKAAGGVQSGGLAVTAWANAGATSTANTVVFNGFGRVANAGAIQRIDLTNTSGSSNTPLRLLIGVGGNIRMCIPSTALSSLDDARAC
jgi:type IV fimbrial biogenesis protein FimT